MYKFRVLAASNLNTLTLLGKAYDHTKHRYRFGFRMLTLGWSDGSTFLPVNSILLSSENKKNRVNEVSDVNKRTAGYKWRVLSILVEVVKDGESIPSKIVYVRNRNKRKEYLCLISTNIISLSECALDENQVVISNGAIVDLNNFGNWTGVFR